MRFAFRFAIVLISAASAAGCGDDSSPADDGSGTGGSTSQTGADARCNTTTCTQTIGYDFYEVDECEALLGGACGAEFIAQRDCYLENETCTADDKQDLDSVETICEAQYDAFMQCGADNIPD